MSSPCRSPVQSDRADLPSRTGRPLLWVAGFVLLVLVGAVIAFTSFDREVITPAPPGLQQPLQGEAGQPPGPAIAGQQPPSGRRVEVDVVGPVLVEIHVEVRATNSRMNLVYPFYLAT